MYGIFGGITTMFHTAIRFPVTVAILATVGVVVNEVEKVPEPIPVVKIEVPVVIEIPIVMVDRIIPLNGVNFDTNSSKLSEKAKRLLNIDVIYAKSHPNAVLEIVGHTDIRGSQKLNQPLSEARALSVKKYLLDHGVVEVNIVTRGDSFFYPAENDSTKKALAANRRVEVKALVKEVKENKN